MVYLDYSASTPVDPDVFEAMRPFFMQLFGNASSRGHGAGWIADAAVEKARRHIAEWIGADPSEVVFTSGATESNNLAILGAAEMYEGKGRHIVTTAIEHTSVLDPCRYLETKGFEVTRVGVDGAGRLDVRALTDAIRSDTILVTVMHANNELGTLNPISEIGALCKERRVLFHTDAAQSAGKVPLNVQSARVDLVSLSAHKIYGPKGVGALYVRRRNPRVRLVPRMHGGGHERGFRSGTLNVPAIVGFGKAAELAGRRLAGDSRQLELLRDRLWTRLCEGLDGIHLNGDGAERVPGVLNVRFDGVFADAVMGEMKDVAVSSGAACASGEPEPSHVLLALGLSEAQSRSSIRFSLGRPTTAEDVEFAAQRVIDTVRKLRASSAVFETDEPPRAEP